MPLHLRPRESNALCADLGGVTPEALAAAGPGGIGNLVVRADGESVALGDIVAISGRADDGVIECEGDFSRFHGIGRGMTRGAIVVRGGVGDFAGARMSGGRLTVEGSAGRWLGAGLSGGTIHVLGDVGDDGAAALPGDSFGPTGGEVLVDGSAGDRLACRMRRGIEIGRAHV